MTSIARRLPVGAEPQPGGGVHFRLWSPHNTDVAVHVERERGDPLETRLRPDKCGYVEAYVSDAGAGDRYWFLLGSERLPDPASRFQPHGPFGPSEIVDARRFTWSDSAWRGVGLRGQVIYEMHCGTFTREGTWRAAMEKLPHLKDVGITVVETMPIGEFPGKFGWGYDGVFLFAPTRLYGTPDDFRAFVDRAHALGLAVILDVVYNHFGPDGAVFRRFAQDYFSRTYDNEWGDALNFDGDRSNGLRDYVITNAQYWIDEYHLDGLRLDATQAIHDRSREHVLKALGHAAREAAGTRQIVLIAENERQQTQLVRPIDRGGYGLDALWNDDFHHSAVVALTGRCEAYYSDYRGTPQELMSAVKHGYLFQGQRYAWQRQPRGTSTRGLEPARFVNYLENHDQVANSAAGARLRAHTSPGNLRAMTALLLLAPGTPLLFQGQEFGATSAFLYFADHGPELAEAVRKGRAEFLSQFPSLASDAVRARLAVPHDPATFERSKIRWQDDWHEPTYRLHRDLLKLRRTDAAFRRQDLGAVDGAVLGPEAFVLRFFAETPADDRLLMVNLSTDIVAGSIAEPLVAPPEGRAWRLHWSSESPDYDGQGVPAVVTDDGWNIPGRAAVVLASEEHIDASHRAD